ncbi:hypothetical protein EYC80_009737 [Monilinia laxa]|uniref:Uncharacterized protein n=1 Tax=Monilinia laxa TaxID=61186 RepID=A0A5N6JYT0_MONLA|nr:hypothetical protein EYC80_009737 [Monilinia laxa]
MFLLDPTVAKGQIKVAIFGLRGRVNLHSIRGRMLIYYESHYHKVINESLLWTSSNMQKMFKNIENYWKISTQVDKSVV